MNPLQALTLLAQALPAKYRKLAYYVSLTAILLVASLIFFSVPQLLPVTWVKLEAALAVVAAVLNGVAAVNVDEKDNGKHRADVAPL